MPSNGSFPVIRVENVSLFREKTSILQNIDWEVKKRQHWVLLGKNGSGKTMLLRTITGYQWPTTGKIFILGSQFGHVNIRELRKEIGWVSSDLQQQMQQQFSASEVVLSGYFASIGLYDKPTKTIEQKAERVMDFMECSHLAKRSFPLLSFGQQKRVLIARSLIHNPKLLILDEPCTGLDLESREHFLTFVEKIGRHKKGPTIIMVTHHIEEIVPSISHALCLKNGKVEAKGEKKKILTEEILQTLLDINLRVVKHGERFQAITE